MVPMMTIARALAATILLVGLCQCGGGANAPLDIDKVDYPIDDSTVVTLERTICYGTCPAYQLTIAGDGAVSYVGKQYVKVVGPASSRIAVSDVQRLVELMMEASYFELTVPEECPDGIVTDASTAITSLTWAGQTHVIENYYGNACAPEVLGTLERQIDQTANSSQWVR